MKKRVQEVFFELMRNAKKSDRNIAKKLGISQPTVTRTRKRLETDGYIKRYTIVPDFSKLGFEIAAFMLFNYKGEEKGFQSQLSEQSNVIFASKGRGGQRENYMMASLHKDFTEYSRFVDSLKKSYGEKVEISETFLIPLKNGTCEGISFKSVEDLIDSL